MAMCWIFWIVWMVTLNCAWALLVPLQHQRILLQHTSFQIKISKPKSKPVLSMHMGHSHSHDHAHHSSAASLPAKPLLQQVRETLTLRRAAWFLVLSLAILGPPVLRKGYQGLHRTHWATWSLTCTLWVIRRGIQNQVAAWLRVLSKLHTNITNHAPSGGDAWSSPGKFYRYLFQNSNAADRVTILGGVMNLALSVGKFAIGVTCHSAALMADAGHSLSDLVSDFITLWAVQIGRLPPDEDHPYGHAKFEAIGSLFLALTLLGTGLSVGWASNQKFLAILAQQRAAGAAVAAGTAATATTAVLPTPPALLMAALSIGSKEWLFRITRQVGEQLQSSVVIANAWHHRSDAYSSVLALLAIGLAMFFPSLIAADAAAGMLVAAMISMTGAEILGESIEQLTDASNDVLVAKVRTVARKYAQQQQARASSSTSDSLPPVLFTVHRIRARQVGSSAMVDVQIETPHNHDWTLAESQQITQGLKQEIMHQVGNVLDVEVHAVASTKTTTAAAAAVSNDGKENTDTVSSSMTTAATTDTMTTTPVNGSSTSTTSIQLLQDTVRSELQTHPAVRSVQGVTVRYDPDSAPLATNSSPELYSVDATIQVMDPATATVAATQTVANELRDSLKRLDAVHTARIFLDLNE